jgi:hypothetical protein
MSYSNAFDSKHGFSINETVGILYTDTDPTSGSGFIAPVGSLLIYVPGIGNPTLYQKIGTGNTQWSEITGAVVNQITGSGTSGQYAEFNGTHTITGGAKSTAFNQNFETSVSNIKMNGSASIGASSNVPRSDHIHPTDTSREPSFSKGNLLGSTGLIVSGGTGVLVGSNVTVSLPQDLTSTGELTFADVTIGNLNRNFVTYGSDTKLATGIPWSERGKFKVAFTYSQPALIGYVTATISFVGANTSFSYYINGKKFTVTSGNIAAYTKTETSAEGTWFFYISQSTTNADSPVLALSQQAWNIYDPDVLLWDAYFNANALTFTWVGEERHTAGRDIFNHARNHAQGAVYKSGLLFSQYNGLTAFSTNTDNNFGRAQVQISGGAFYDEDILNNIAHTDASISSTVTTPSTDWNLTVNQFLGFTALATTGTNTTTIVFTTSRTLVTGQAITVMQGNTTTVRGTTTISAGGTGTSFTVSTVTGLASGDAIVVGARIPVYYISNVSGSNYTWRKLTTTDFVGVSGGAAITAATIATATYQFNNAIAGGFSAMTANRYFPIYLCATNTTSEPVIAILGQGQSTSATLTTTLGEAAFQFANLVGLAGLSIQEVVPFYRLTFHYNTTAGFNQNRMRLVDATFLNVRVATVSGSVLGSPTTTISASMVNTDTTNFNGFFTTSQTTVQSALDRVDDYLQIEITDGNLQMDGAGWAGSLNTVTRGDHRHPSDTTKATDTAVFHKAISSELNALTLKVTPENNDILLIEDSNDSYNKKKILVSNFFSSTGDADAFHKSVSSEIVNLTNKNKLVETDVLLIEDSEDSYSKKLIYGFTLGITSQGVRFPQWAASTEYVAYSLVRYGEQLYIAYSTHTSGSDFEIDLPTYWSPIAIPCAPIKRQTVIYGKNTSNVPSILSTAAYTYGSGLTITLDNDFVEGLGGSTPFGITFAGGNSYNGPVDFVRYFPNYYGVGSLTEYATPFIYCDTTDELRPDYGDGTFNFNLYPPVYDQSYIGYKGQSICATFEGTNGATSYTDLMGNTAVFSAANCTISTAQFKSGSSSIRVAGTNGYVQLPVPYNLPSKWTIHFWWRLDSASGTQSLINASADVSLGITFATNRLTYYLSSDASTWNIANALAGYDTTYSNATWYHSAIVFDGTCYRFFIDGVLDQIASSALQIFTHQYFRLGYSGAGSVPATGYIDNFQFEPYARWTTTFTPPTDLTAPTVHWFDTIKYKMYEGNPTAGWTQKYRTFMGECQTGRVSTDGVITSTGTIIDVITPARVVHNNFYFQIASVGYYKAAAVATLTATTVPSGKWGLFGWEIGVDGTVHSKDAAGNAAGYASEALALAAVPAPTASHILFTYLTVMKSDGNFVGNTTALNAANVTCHITTATILATTVNSVTTYAYNGRYESAETACPAANTTVSFSHNLGTRKYFPTGYIINVSSEYGYFPGDKSPLTMTDGTSAVNVPVPTQLRRNTFLFKGGVNTSFSIQRLDANSYGNVTASKWNVQFTAERAF